MKSTLLILTAISILSMSCQREGTIKFSEFHESVEGSWLLVEEGHSPGSGYVTTPVPFEPAQTISFLPNGTVDSNMEGFAMFKYFEVWQDSVSESTVLSLYEQKPSDVFDRSAASSYSVTFDEEMLKLSFRWCFEGCHMGFRAIERPQEE